MLFRSIAESTRSFGKIYTRKDVRAVDISIDSGLQNEFAELKSLIKGLSPGVQKVRACGICNEKTHPTDACPQLQEDAPADVNAVGGYGPPRPGFERPGYNMRANDHPGFRWSDPSGGQQGFRPPHQQQQGQQGQQYQSRPSGPSTFEMLRELTQHFTTHVKTTESSIKNLEKQMGQLASGSEERRVGKECRL